MQKGLLDASNDSRRHTPSRLRGCPRYRRRRCILGPHIPFRPAAATANTPGGTGAADVSFDPASLTFTTSNWSTPQTVTPIVTEDDDSVAETVTISHTVTSTDSGYDDMDLPDVTMEVKETEPPYTSGLSVSNATANEDDDPPELDFEVTLWPASTDTVTVKYKTIDRTATAGEDYIHTSGTLTFEPGVTGLKVRVTIIDDDVEDDGETLWLKLTDPVGAFFDDSWGLGTIDNTETGGDNTAPTGLPTISGTAQVGETLTASETGIADADGLTGATFAWQWIANDGTNDADIADATDATYTLTAGEQGKTVKVRATFTDDGGTEETLTSAATEAVAAAVEQQVASDTEAPTVTVTSDAAGPVTGDFDVTVTFSEPVTGFEMSELAIVNGTASAMTANEAGDGYTVTVTPDGGASGTLTVEVPAGVASDAAENANTASGAFGIAVRTALTASFSSVAREHDGSSVFLVPLDFSEDVEGLSYRTLKFGGIEVIGGTVKRAKRRPPGSGQGKYWTIHVKPNTDGDVTVVLPETTDCAATGAVCTRDGRMLANASRATIPGPASTPLVSIAAAASPVTEGTAASFTLTRRGGPATALTVDVSVSEDGAMVDGTAPATATFAAGSKTAALTVATADDEVEESASVVTATVSSGTGYMRPDYADLAHFMVVKELTARFDRVTLCVDGDRTNYGSALAVFAHEVQTPCAGAGAFRRAEIGVVQTESEKKPNKSLRPPGKGWVSEKRRLAGAWKRKLREEAPRRGGVSGAKAQLFRRVMKGGWSEVGGWGWLERPSRDAGRLIFMWLSQGPDRDWPPEEELDRFLEKVSLQSVDSAIGAMRERAAVLSRPEHRAGGGVSLRHASENVEFAATGLWLSWFAFNYDNLETFGNGYPQTADLLGLLRREDRRGFPVKQRLDFCLGWRHAVELTKRLGSG